MLLAAAQLWVRLPHHRKMPLKLLQRRSRVGHPFRQTLDFGVRVIGDDGLGHAVRALVNASILPCVTRWLKARKLHRAAALLTGW